MCFMSFILGCVLFLFHILSCIFLPLIRGCMCYYLPFEVVLVFVSHMWLYMFLFLIRGYMCFCFIDAVVCGFCFKYVVQVGFV